VGQDSTSIQPSAIGQIYIVIQEGAAVKGAATDRRW